MQWFWKQLLQTVSPIALLKALAVTLSMHLSAVCLPQHGLAIAAGQRMAPWLRRTLCGGANNKWGPGVARLATHASSLTDLRRIPYSLVGRRALGAGISCAGRMQQAVHPPTIAKGSGCDHASTTSWAIGSCCIEMRQVASPAKRPCLGMVRPILFCSMSARCARCAQWRLRRRLFLVGRHL